MCARGAARVVRPLRRGQITIPAEFREALNITDDTLLLVELHDGKLELSPLKVSPAEPGSAWLKEIYDMFADVRKGAERIGEDEINADIDAAVKASRARRR